MVLSIPDFKQFANLNSFITEVPMDWFLYDRDLRHERIKGKNETQKKRMQNKRMQIKLTLNIKITLNVNC